MCISLITQCIHWYRAQQSRVFPIISHDIIQCMIQRVPFSFIQFYTARQNSMTMTLINLQTSSNLNNCSIFLWFEKLNGKIHFTVFITSLHWYVQIRYMVLKPRNQAMICPFVPPTTFFMSSMWLQLVFTGYVHKVLYTITASDLVPHNYHQ